MSNAIFNTEEFAFRMSGAMPNGVCEARAMSEAQFLAGEDARGVFVVLEPETPLGAAQLDALAAREVLGLISDFTDGWFEKPDEIYREKQGKRRYNQRSGDRNDFGILRFVGCA